jgi:hypothetical protein
LNDECNAVNLQKQEKYEVKISADEQKNVTHIKQSLKKLTTTKAL